MMLRFALAIWILAVACSLIWGAGVAARAMADHGVALTLGGRVVTQLGGK